MGSRIIDVSLLKAEAVSYYRRVTHSIATKRRDQTIRSCAGSFGNQGVLSPMGRNSGAYTTRNAPAPENGDEIVAKPIAGSITSLNTSHNTVGLLRTRCA